MTEPAPRIENAAWGKIDVEGTEKRFKDAKLFPGGAREWDWTETGTRHDPGVQEADIQELLDQGAEHIILSQGYWKRLKVPESTRSFIQDRGIRLEVLPTGEAVERYNQLLEEKEKLGALIHSTC